MRFAAHAIGIFAADVERLAQDRRVAEGQAVALDRLARDLPRPTPSTWLFVPVKYLATKSLRKPTASKICAPQ